MQHIDYEAHTSACSGQCNQGRQPCLTPDACRLSEREEERAGMQMLVYLLAVGVVSALALVIAIWS